MRALHSSVVEHNRSNLASTRKQQATGSSGLGRHKTSIVRTLRADESTRRVLAILKIILHKRPVHVREVAREVHMSPSHLQHLFKKETGISLGHLLTEQRLQRAVYLLVHSDMRIKEIASSVGYVHAPSFIRAFERRFGQSPDLYRRRRDAIG